MYDVKMKWRQGVESLEWYAENLGEWVQWRPGLGHPQPPADMVEKGSTEQIQWLQRALFFLIVIVVLGLVTLMN